MTKVLNGRVIALFAFDIGFEVALEQLSELPSSAPVQPLSPKKQTPTFLQYAKLPHVVHLGEIRPILSEAGRAQVTVFDFGAASIAYQWLLPVGPQALPLADLPRLSRMLYDLNLEVQSKQQIQRFMEQIRSAIVRPELSPLVEDYYLFVIEEFDQSWSGADLLSRHGSTIAQVLRFETQPLSLEQQKEALAQRLSYYENDLVIVDWNAAFVYDRDYHDTANVLELLNVELLEARYIDAQLDRRIGDYQRLSLKHRDWLVPLRTPIRKAIQELAELRLESLLLAERVDNALKLIGDLYLARVHAAAAQRLYLQDWENAISRKLDIIASLYQLLTDRVRTAQSQTLELVIIALILAEILLAVFSLSGDANMGSAIWAVCHTPFELSGVQHIDGDSPLELALTQPFGIFAAGLVFGWLWVKTESIGVVSLAHGALNNWGQYALKYMQFVRARESVVGLAGILVVLVLGVLLLTRLNQNRRSSLEVFWAGVRRAPERHLQYD